jgi:lipopolysaccharide/colanic/teichoic acid biosynthesis glycosyltransferase
MEADAEARRFLQRYSIDELPQRFNVLVGNMSLVGPQPTVPVEGAKCQTFERRRRSMRPGITCLWQVSGRNAIGFDGWVRLDLEYIDTGSPANDFSILFRPLPAVLSGDCASSRNSLRKSRHAVATIARTGASALSIFRSRAD